MEALTTDSVGSGILPMRLSRVTTRAKMWVFLLLLGGWMGGCASHRPVVELPPRANVVPEGGEASTDVLRLDASPITPM
ncbi:MAG: hypothetical protein IIB59_01035 [Planctomycetes bacterium]|nr:hypothetical protein [Planctomycetota bacterium]